MEKTMTSSLGWSYTESAWFGQKGGVTLDRRNLHDRLLEGDTECGGPKQWCVLIKTLKR